MQQKAQASSEIDLLRATLLSEEARISLSESELEDVSALKNSLEEVHEQAERREKSHSEEREAAQRTVLALSEATARGD